VTRVLSGAVLLVITFAVVWSAPPLLFLVVAEALLLLGVVEYAALARAVGLAVPTVIAAAAAALTCASLARLAFGGYPSVPIDAVLLSALVAIGAWSLTAWRGGSDALATAAAAVFPALYLGLPLGAMIAVRETRGREALLALMLTVIVSDTAQYYAGRAFGRRPLAPAISPNKTIEGAIGGFVFGGLFLAAIGRSWLPVMPVAFRVLLGVTIVAVGIAGDLFESMLKRSAGVKDSSHLIPGHGGILDRIDALLFAAPVYYVVLTHV
jgi:phosphatidate cytidylyltransferase